MLDFGGGGLISSERFLAIFSVYWALLTIHHKAREPRSEFMNSIEIDRMKNSSLFPPLSDKDELRTPEQVRVRFERRGVSVAAWARSQGFNVVLTYMVAAGQRKSLRGQSHQIAVALGMKRADDSNHP